MPRLCILTQYFPPEMGAPQARLSELAHRLARSGWTVEVLTALPNYPTGRVFAGYDPLKPVVETHGPLKVARVPLFTAKTGFVKRLGSYGSFAASARLFGPRLCARPDLLLCESPPLFIGYATRALARHWRCPYVFNVSDLWPESAIRMGMIKPGLATRMAERLELSMYRNAASVTGQSEEIVNSVRARVPAARTKVITNGVDPSRFGRERADAEARLLLGPEAGPIFIFAGLLGYAQGLDQVLDLAASLGEGEHGRFVLVGEGPERERLQARIEREAITRVRLVPPQPRDRVPALLAAADVALVSLGMTLPGAVPSKIYEAMASALPILLVAEGEAARRVLDARCGLAARPGARDDIRAAALRLARDPALRAELGANGRRAAETRYNRDAIARDLDGFLRELL